MGNQLADRMITEGLYAVGKNVDCNAYLLMEGGNGILIDPGPVAGFEAVFADVQRLLPLDKITHVIVQHQSSICWASLILWEQKGLKATVVTHGATAKNLQHFGVSSDSYLIEEQGFELRLPSGRNLQFFVPPYIHLEGIFITYDALSKTLFSGNLFTAFMKRHQETLVEEGYEGQYLTYGEWMQSLMNRLLRSDIDRIAPRMGSLVDGDVAAFISKLHEWEYGNGNESKLSSSKRYLLACNRVVEKLHTLYDPSDINAILKKEGVLLDEASGLILDYGASGVASWNKLFEVIFREKGLALLEMLEPLTQSIRREHAIPVPEIIHSKLLKRDKKIKEINDKYRKLESFNKNLVASMEKIQNKFIRCPVTGLFNEMFFLDYMKNAYGDFPNASLCLIDIDNLADIRLKYGTRYRDETLKNLAYLLKRDKGEKHRVFKLQDSQFAYFITETERSEAIAIAEQFRKKTSQSNLFRDRITLSVGMVFFDEVTEGLKKPESITEFLNNTAYNRLRIAKLTGNSVCSETKAKQNEDAVKNVLLVDGDELTLDLLKRALEKEGFSVRTARDGLEALALTKQDRISLVISELMLPKMDGLLLKENLSFDSERNRIPFILMSHQKDKTTVERAFEMQVRHYLKKPFMFTELIGITKNILRGSE